MFTPAVAKLAIGSLDNTKLSIEAHYNPKELSYTRTVPWAAHELADKASKDQLEVEFTGAQPRSMEIELMFDGFETQETVQTQIEILDQLAEVDEDLRRPHFCIVTWGDRGIRPLRCVIESLAVKYTMVDRMGLPLRAMCNLKVRQAHLQGDFDGNEREQMAALRRQWTARQG